MLLSTAAPAGGRGRPRRRWSRADAPRRPGPAPLQRGESLYFQLYVYNVVPDVSGASDVVLQAQIRSGDKLIAASKPQPVTFQQKDGVPLPQSNGMSLEGFDPGRYELRVVVVDRLAATTASATSISPWSSMPSAVAHRQHATHWSLRRPLRSPAAGEPREGPGLRDGPRGPVHAGGAGQGHRPLRAHGGEPGPAADRRRAGARRRAPVRRAAAGGRSPWSSTRATASSRRLPSAPRKTQLAVADLGGERLVHRWGPGDAEGPRAARASRAHRRRAARARPGRRGVTGSPARGQRREPRSRRLQRRGPSWLWRRPSATGRTCRPGRSWPASSGSGCTSTTTSTSPCWASTGRAPPAVTTRAPTSRSERESAPGILIDGRLHRGHHLMAGEIAFMCMAPGHVDEDFGDRGCLETLAGLDALAARWLARPGQRRRMGGRAVRLRRARATWRRVPPSSTWRRSSASRPPT